MEIFWSVVLVAGILILAYWIRKASKGTPFENDSPGGGPDIEQFRHLEEPDEKEKK